MWSNLKSKNRKNRFWKIPCNSNGCSMIFQKNFLLKLKMKKIYTIPQNRCLKVCRLWKIRVKTEFLSHKMCFRQNSGGQQILALRVQIHFWNLKNKKILKKPPLQWFLSKIKNKISFQLLKTRKTRKSFQLFLRISMRFSIFWQQMPWFHHKILLKIIQASVFLVYGKKKSKKKKKKSLNRKGKTIFLRTKAHFLMHSCPKMPIRKWSEPQTNTKSEKQRKKCSNNSLPCKTKNS